MKVAFIKLKLDLMLCYAGRRGVIMIIIVVALAQIQNRLYHTMPSHVFIQVTSNLIPFSLTSLSL